MITDLTEENCARPISPFFDNCLFIVELGDDGHGRFALQDDTTT